MSFKVPSITHNVCALKEVVLNGVTGVSLPLETSADEFADKIIQIIENPNVYKEMKENCLTDFKEKYTPEAFVDRLRQISQDFKYK